MKNVNQHTVPQCYLRGFGCERPNQTVEGRKQIFVFDKGRKVSHLDTIRKITVGKRFYDIPEEIVSEDFKPEFDRKSVDKALQEAEGLLSTTLREARNLRLGQVVPVELQYDLAYLIAVQVARGFDMRRALVEAWVKLNQTVSDDLVALNFPESYDLRPQFEFDERYHSVLHARYLCEQKLHEDFAKGLLSHIWIFGVVSNGRSLYISDNPGVRRTTQKQSTSIPAKLVITSAASVCEIAASSVLPGFQEKGIEIFYPLNANLLLILKDRTSFPIHEALDGRVVKAFDADIELNNRLQVEQSVRQIYCQSKDFDLARKVCEEKPEVCEVDRIRSVVTSGIEKPTKLEGIVE